MLPLSLWLIHPGCGSQALTGGNSSYGRLPDRLPHFLISHGADTSCKLPASSVLQQHMWVVFELSQGLHAGWAVQQLLLSGAFKPRKRWLLCRAELKRQGLLLTGKAKQEAQRLAAVRESMLRNAGTNLEGGRLQGWTMWCL